MKSAEYGRRARVCLAMLAVAAAAGAGTELEAQEGARMGASEDQRIVLITGSTDGLGREVARRLGGGGAHVIVHGRNAERGRAAVEEIVAAGGSGAFFPADLSSLADVRALADTLRRHYARIDVLVNNAGIWRPSGARALSADGHELHFAVNYLAGYLLTHELLPLIRAGRSPRIVNVASGAQAPIDFADVMLEGTYSGSRAYAQSKLAQIMFTVDLAEQLRSDGVTVVALHPATLMNTSMVESAGVAPRSTIAEGAAAVMNLIEGDVQSGEYYDGQRRARPHAQAQDAAARARLRDLSRQLTGLR